jgi:hypothetical protein
MSTTAFRSAIQTQTTAALYAILGDMRMGAPDTTKRVRAIAMIRAELQRRGA